MSNNKFKILIVEDEPTICSFIYTLLDTNGYKTYVAPTCELGKSIFTSYLPDLIILDLGLPDRDGRELIHYVRQKFMTPIIVLSARTTEADKIEALDLGANDYITKPFNILELKARVRALLRRAGMAAQKQGGGGRLSMGHITLDVDARAAWKDGKSVDLTAKEFDLMELLLRNPGRVYSRENLLNVVWGYEYVGDYRTVDVHIRRLREKLELDPANPEYIRTKWGVGYYLSSQKNSG